MWGFESNAPVKYNSTVIFLHLTCLLTPPPCTLTLLALCWFIFCPDPGPISNLETNITFWTILLFDSLVWALCKTIYQQRLELCQVFSKPVISYRMARSCLKQGCRWCGRHIRHSPGARSRLADQLRPLPLEEKPLLGCSCGVLISCSALVRLGLCHTFQGPQDILP